jgi:SAM-dependent methyltransferase
MTFADAKQRFSNRVADYIRYRPGYPSSSLDLLRKECGLRSAHVVADIGSGTGLLSKLFLENGNRVFGVEPNAEMRSAGEECLQGCAKFTSVNGSAEATTLDDACVDFVAAGQAFHWFEPHAARQEFKRILRADGWVVVIWNERLTDTTPFLRDYEALLQKFGTDYTRVNESYPRPEQMRDFFGSDAYGQRHLPNAQEFDYQGLCGRLRSSSFVPAEGHANFVPMMTELDRIFHLQETNGRVHMEYLTRLYFGRLDLRRNTA